MSDLWRGFLDMSKQRSKHNDEYDLLKRAVLCAPDWALAAYVWYYLWWKRHDLAKRQKVALSVCGAGYATWNAATYAFGSDDFVPEEFMESKAILTSFLTSSVYIYAPAYFAKAPGEDDTNIGMKYATGSVMYSFGLYGIWRARSNYREGYAFVLSHASELLMVTGWSMFSFNKWLTAAEVLWAPLAVIVGVIAGGALVFAQYCKDLVFRDHTTDMKGDPDCPV